MLANIFDENIIKVLGLFSISPGSRYLRKEIKEKTGMNNVPLDDALNRLLSFRILKKEKNLLTLNPESNFNNIFDKIRKEFTEFNIPLGIYFIILSISNNLSKFPEIKDVYLFGSYAKLIYHENSDIDVAVIFYNHVKEKSKLEKEIGHTINKIGKKNEKEIQIHFFNEKDMKAKDPLIKDILKNGKKLL